MVIRLINKQSSFQQGRSVSIDFVLKQIPQAITGTIKNERTGTPVAAEAAVVLIRRCQQGRRQHVHP